MGRTEPRHASPRARRVSRNRDRSQGEGPGFCRTRVDPSDDLKTILRPYQQAGVRWLHLLSSLGGLTQVGRDRSPEASHGLRLRTENPVPHLGGPPRRGCESWPVRKVTRRGRGSNRGSTRAPLTAWPPTGTRTAKRACATYPSFLTYRSEQILGRHTSDGPPGDIGEWRLCRLCDGSHGVHATVLTPNLDLSLARGLLKHFGKTLPCRRVRIQLHRSNSTRDKPSFLACRRSGPSSASSGNPDDRAASRMYASYA
jgi:hypothetical protein